MRNVIKYGLVLAVLASGVYGANHFRIANEPVALAPTLYDLDPYSLPSEPAANEAADAPSQPPLAVLIDTDRQPEQPTPEERAPTVQNVPSITQQEPLHPEENVPELPELASEPGDRFAVPQEAKQQDEPEQEEPEQDEPEQEEPEQEEPKQDEPKQDEPKQDEPKQDEPKQDEPKQDEPKQDEPKQDEPKQDEPKQDEPKQDEPEQDEPEQDEPEQDEPEQDEPEQDEPEQEEPEQEEPEQDEPEQDEPEQDEPEQDEPKQEEPEQEEPEQEEAVSPGRTQDGSTSHESDEAGTGRFGPHELPAKHVIGEGDTLPKLAERYLGDRDRYLEIFQTNRDVLPDPRLLPLGVQLTIISAADADVSNRETESQGMAESAGSQPQTSSDARPPQLQPIPPELLGSGRD